MNILLETAVAAIFLAGILAVSFLYIRRTRSMERQLGLLMKAALNNTRDIRHCSEVVKSGFTNLGRAENHQRALLASLNSQMSNLNAMLEASSRPQDRPVAFVPVVRGGEEETAAPAAERPARPFEVVGGREAPIPGYQSVRNRSEDNPVIANGDAAGLQRKIKTIEELFRKVELPLAAVAKTGVENHADQDVASLHPVSPPSFADLVSQRRRVANG